MLGDIHSVSQTGFVEPLYVQCWKSGDLQNRVRQAWTGLRECHLCPRLCHLNREQGEEGFCRTGRYALVPSAFPHHGEERCLSGTRGSGTIFFASCNLRCVFCQNFQISWQAEGTECRAGEIAALMLQLQEQQCHNINLVTPSHVIPQLLDAILQAVAAGLRLPLVYNSSGYDSVESLQLLDGVVDIYMPDFKFWRSEIAERYAAAPDYPQVARCAIAEMNRQVGPLQISSDGIARRGVLLRHLVMPGGVADTAQIMQWAAKTLGPTTYVNIMHQYRPCGWVCAEEFDEINRTASNHEYRKAVEAAVEAGLTRIDGLQPQDSYGRTSH